MSDNVRATFDRIYQLETHSFSGRRGVPRVQKKAHWHNDIELNFLTSGAVTYLWHGQIRKISALSLSLFWGGMPHQTIAVDEGTECYWFYIPLAWFLQWKLPSRFVQALLSGIVISEVRNERSSSDRDMVNQWHDDLRGNGDEERAVAVLEIHARLRRMALNALPSAPALLNRRKKSLRGPVERLEAMVNFMALNYGERLTLGQIAKAARLHPNYASSLFKKACGISMQTYLNRLRVSHAQRLLATTDIKIIDVAMHAGFSSVSRFYDAFKAASGCSPSAYRKSVTQTP